MAEAIAHVRKAGGLFIADEVQPGFARTGETMWGFARHGLVPDMVAMGKPMGNGYPIGGVAVKPDLLATFGATTGYFNTFGGNPVATAAGPCCRRSRRRSCNRTRAKPAPICWRRLVRLPSASLALATCGELGSISGSSSCATADRRRRTGRPQPASWTCCATATFLSA